MSFFTISIRWNRNSAAIFDGTRLAPSYTLVYNSHEYIIILHTHMYISHIYIYYRLMLPHTHTETYTHTYLRTYLLTYFTLLYFTLLTYLLTYIHAYMLTCLHTYLLTYLHPSIHPCMHACIHTYILTYLHTYGHIHGDISIIYIYRFILPWSPISQVVFTPTLAHRRWKDEDQRSTSSLRTGWANRDWRRIYGGFNHQKWGKHRNSTRKTRD